MFVEEGRRAGRSRRRAEEAAGAAAEAVLDPGATMPPCPSLSQLYYIPIEQGFLRPSVMGIVNVTPDSFSDGGVNLDPDARQPRRWRMVEDGAAIVDIGGESTRPGRKASRSTRSCAASCPC